VGLIKLGLRFMKLKVRRSFWVFQIITIKEEAAIIGDRDTGQAVNDMILELPPAKQLLAEILRTRPEDIEDMIQSCLTERLDAKSNEWPATFSPSMSDHGQGLGEREARRRRRPGRLRALIRFAGRGWQKWPRSAPARLSCAR